VSLSAACAIGADDTHGRSVRHLECVIGSGYANSLWLYDCANQFLSAGAVRVDSWHTGNLPF